MDCSPPGSPIREILQIRILEWPFPPPGDLPDPGIEWTSPALAGGFFTTGPPGNAPDDYIKKIFFWPYCAACGISVPQPRIEPMSPALEAWSLNHRTIREAL